MSLQRSSSFSFGVPNFLETVNVASSYSTCTTNQAAHELHNALKSYKSTGSRECLYPNSMDAYVLLYKVKEIISAHPGVTRIRDDEGRLLLRIAFENSRELPRRVLWLLAFVHRNDHFPAMPPLLEIVPKNNNPHSVVRFYDFFMDDAGHNMFNPTKAFFNDFVKRDPGLLLPTTAVDPITGNNLLHLMFGVQQTREGSYWWRVQYFFGRMIFYLEGLLESRRTTVQERLEINNVILALMELARQQNNKLECPLHGALKVPESYNPRSWHLAIFGLTLLFPWAIKVPFCDQQGEYPLHRILRAKDFWSLHASYCKRWYSRPLDDLESTRFQTIMLAISAMPLGQPDRYGVIPFVRAALQPDMPLTMLFLLLQQNPTVVLNLINRNSEDGNRDRNQNVNRAN